VVVGEDADFEKFRHLLTEVTKSETLRANLFAKAAESSLVASPLGRERSHLTLLGDVNDDMRVKKMATRRHASQMWSSQRSRTDLLLDKSIDSGAAKSLNFNSKQ